MVYVHGWKLNIYVYILFFFLNGQQTQSRVFSGHPLDKRSTPRVTRVHHQFRGKPGNPPARRHDGEITGKTRLAQGSNQVSLGLLSLPTNASLCTKWESNLHLSREMQALYHLI
ncbi:hypothetical protein HanIR_Chr15g0747201 [Helianthus annuus]|nr:hypothetical protein HanIR_Chr15g0747201 [Helianthus annuus]